MSSPAFATLLRKHPGEEQFVASVQDAMVTMVRRNPAATIDEKRLEAVTHIKIGVLEIYLGDLVAAGALEPRYALLCANGKGPAAEALHLSALPDTVECDRCGDEHSYSRDRVEVFFVATTTFVKSLLTK